MERIDRDGKRYQVSVTFFSVKNFPKCVILRLCRIEIFQAPTIVVVFNVIAWVCSQVSA